MGSSRRLWLGFAAAALAVLAAVSWLSVAVLRLEGAAERTRRELARQEQLRQALWRLEAQVSPLVTRLAALAYSSYAPAVAPPRLYRPGGEPLRLMALERSPVLEATWPDWLLLHFQARIDGAVTSPQVPEGAFAWVGPATPDRSAPLAWLRGALTAATRQALLEGGDLGPAPPPPPAPQGRRPPSQQALAANDWVSQRQANPPAVYEPEDNLANNVGVIFRRRLGGGGAKVTVGTVRGAWLGAGDDRRLVLYRLADIGGERVVQGALLDWPRLRGALCGLLADLVPRCELVPAHASVPEEGQLVSLPIALRAVHAGAALPWYGTRLARPELILAWALALLALAATALALRRFAELGERRTDFVSAVSHELRAPLTAFRLHLDLLADGMIPEEADRRAALETLRGQAERLSDLVRSVLDYARLERRSFVPALEELDAATLFAELAADAAPRCEAAGMTLAAEPPPPLRLRSDPGAVRQIIANLIENACKYAAAADDRRVHLRGRALGGSVLLEVEDHGAGVPAGERRRIFLPFVRAGREATREHPGVGLGLALAQRFARALGGELSLVGAADGGRVPARFVLRLPAR